MQIFAFINFSTNLKEKCRRLIFGFGGGSGRLCTAVFCQKNWELGHVRLWIWIWMGNFISTASLLK